MIEFFKKGMLNDNYIRRVIGCMMFWAHFNNVSPNSGLALNEYAYQKGDNCFASIENNIFLKAMNQYHPLEWLDIALDRKQQINPISDIPVKAYDFKVTNEHHLMHMAEMFCITRLYYNDTLTAVEKVLLFFEWNLKNLRICQYSLVFSLLVFSNNSKVFKKVKAHDFDQLFKVCSNQSWDITYLSDWSTLYWNDSDNDTVYLFATMDKELKKLFIENHTLNYNLFSKYFSQSDSKLIEAKFEDLKNRRIKPKINSQIIRDFYEAEHDLLVKSVEDSTF
jgi:hypothetical protein